MNAVTKTEFLANLATLSEQNTVQSEVLATKARELKNLLYRLASDGGLDPKCLNSMNFYLSREKSYQAALVDMEPHIENLARALVHSWIYDVNPTGAVDFMNSGAGRLLVYAAKEEIRNLPVDGILKLKDAVSTLSPAPQDVFTKTNTEAGGGVKKTGETSSGSAGDLPKLVLANSGGNSGSSTPKSAPADTSSQQKPGPVNAEGRPASPVRLDVGGPQHEASGEPLARYGRSQASLVTAGKSKKSVNEFLASGELARIIPNENVFKLSVLKRASTVEVATVLGTSQTSLYCKSALSYKAALSNAGQDAITAFDPTAPLENLDGQAGLKSLVNDLFQATSETSSTVDVEAHKTRASETFSSLLNHIKLPAINSFRRSFAGTSNKSAERMLAMRIDNFVEYRCARFDQGFESGDSPFETLSQDLMRLDEVPSNRYRDPMPTDERALGMYELNWDAVRNAAHTRRTALIDQLLQALPSIGRDREESRVLISVAVDKSIVQLLRHLKCDDPQASDFAQTKNELYASVLFKLREGNKATYSPLGAGKLASVCLELQHLGVLDFSRGGLTERTDQIAGLLAHFFTPQSSSPTSDPGALPSKMSLPIVNPNDLYGARADESMRLNALAYSALDCAKALLQRLRDASGNNVNVVEDLKKFSKDLRVDKLVSQAGVDPAARGRRSDPQAVGVSFSDPSNQLKLKQYVRAIVRDASSPSINSSQTGDLGKQIDGLFVAQLSNSGVNLGEYDSVVLKAAKSSNSPSKLALSDFDGRLSGWFSTQKDTIEQKIIKRSNSPEKKAFARVAADNNPVGGATKGHDERMTLLSLAMRDEVWNAIKVDSTAPGFEVNRDSFNHYPLLERLGFNDNGLTNEQLIQITKLAAAAVTSNAFNSKDLGEPRLYGMANEAAVNQFANDLGTSRDSSTNTLRRGVLGTHLIDVMADVIRVGQPNSPVSKTNRELVGKLLSLMFIQSAKDRGAPLQMSAPAVQSTNVGPQTGGGSGDAGTSGGLHHNSSTIAPLRDPVAGSSTALASDSSTIRDPSGSRPGPSQRAVRQPLSSVLVSEYNSLIAAKLKSTQEFFTKHVDKKTGQLPVHFQEIVSDTLLTLKTMIEDLGELELSFTSEYGRGYFERMFAELKHTIERAIQRLEAQEGLGKYTLFNAALESVWIANNGLSQLIGLTGAEMPKAPVGRR